MTCSPSLRCSVRAARRAGHSSSTTGRPRRRQTRPPCSRCRDRLTMHLEPRADQPLVIEIEGDLDVARAGGIGDWLCSLIETGPPAIAIECTGVSLIESRGLAMMARGQRFAEETGCPLTWRCLPLPALRTIHLSGLDGYLHIEA